MALARLCGEKWQCGLIPSWTIEFVDPSGPVVRDSVKVGLNHLSGDFICPGRSSCSVPLEFGLKSGISEGDRDTLRFVFALTNPTTGAVQTTDWAVDVVIRPGGKPLLISEEIPFPSEGKN